MIVTIDDVIEELSNRIERHHKSALDTQTNGDKNSCWREVDKASALMDLKDWIRNLQKKGTENG
jgi:CBS domain containing-hemolysin-like protein